MRGLAEVAHDAVYALSPSTWLHKWPKFDVSQSSAAVEFFDAHGWVIFSRVFDGAEIDHLRQYAERSMQTSHAGDLLSNPHLGGRRFVFDDRVLKVAGAVLRGTPCYFGDSSVSVDIGAMGFHKDNPDKEESEAPDWQGRYTIIRIGLYLQDHAWHSGGLALRDRSHVALDTRKGRPLALPSEPGDLVLWSLRTTHSGYATRLRGFPKVFVPIPVVQQLALADDVKTTGIARLFRPRQFEQRMALFATFGIEDEHLRRYLAYLQTRQYAVQAWQASTYGQQMYDDARSKGVNLISMRERVAHLDLAKLNKMHVYFPWKV